MTHTRTLARIAGCLYLLVAVLGGFSELYVRSSLTVAGDAATTALNIAEHAMLFRVGFVTDLVAYVAFLGVGLALNVVLRPVNPQLALVMLVLNAVSVAIQALNMLNQLGALLIATDPAFTVGLSPAAAQSLVLLLLELHRHGYLIAQIFFGLYLLPLGYLVYTSGYFPKVLGVGLMLGCAGYLGEVVAIYLSPDLQSNLGLSLGMLGGLSEVAFLLWLLVMGVGHRAPVVLVTARAE
jgi:hypothetical protein